MTLVDKRALLLSLLYVANTLAQRRGGSGGYGGNDGDGDNDAQEDAMEARADAMQFRMRMLLAHGVMMSLAFAFMMPFGSSLIRLLKFRGSAYIHGIWQTVAYLIALAGAGIGIWFAVTGGYIREPHAIIGIIVIGMLFLQPLGGLLAHLFYKRKQRRNFFGLVHRWNGRIFVTLAGINGGLGIQLAGNRRVWVIAYSVVAAFFFAFWYAVSIFDWVKNRRKSVRRGSGDEKAIVDGRNSESA